MVISAKLISGSLLRVFQSQPSPEAWFWGLKNKVEPVQLGVDPIQPVVVERDSQAELQDGHSWGPPLALELCLQLSAALPELWCSPALPGPTEPAPVSGLTSWTGLPGLIPVALHVYPRAVSDPVHLTGSDPDPIAPSTSDSGSCYPWKSANWKFILICLPHVQNSIHRYLQFFKDCTSDMSKPFRWDKWSCF